MAINIDIAYALKTQIKRRGKKAEESILDYLNYTLKKEKHYNHKHTRHRLL
jgi:hypothetical protein